MNLPNYLPGLNTVRFYAAMSVVVAHVYYGAPVTPFFLSGHNAVTLFFVLSGYLITYRLLVERQRNGEYDLKAFYIRRELRILPLYYLSFVVGALVLPTLGAPVLAPDVLLAVALLVPQIPHAYASPMGLVSPLWSIGVEEAFYLTFPFLLRRFRLVPLAWAVGFTAILIGLLAWATNVEASYLARHMRFECMAVGALMAYAVVNRSRWLLVFRHRAVEVVSIAALACVVAFDAALPLFHDLFFAVLCATFLVNISTNPRPLLRLEYRWSKVGGELTYGIYIWHWIVIWLAAFLFTGHALSVASVIGTLVIAALSYRFIEKPILGLKDRWRPTISATAPA